MINGKLKREIISLIGIPKKRENRELISNENTPRHGHQNWWQHDPPKCFPVLLADFYRGPQKGNYPGKATGILGFCNSHLLLGGWVRLDSNQGPRVYSASRYIENLVEPEGVEPSTSTL